MKQQRFFTVILALALSTFAGCAEPQNPTASIPPDQPGVTVTFDYEEQSGYASNQFAVWIEDADGNLIKTLYATRFTANGGYKNRPDSIPVWVEKSGLADMESADAVSGATPDTGKLSYFWNLTGADGSLVPAGTYKYLVEGSLRWKNRVLYSGEITIGGKAASSAAEAELFYEASPDQPALTDESLERGMIGAVTAEYRP